MLSSNDAVAGEQPAASDLVQSVAAESDDDDEDDDRRKRMPAGVP